MPSKKERRTQSAENFLSGLDAARDVEGTASIYDPEVQTREQAEAMTANLFGGGVGTSAAELETRLAEMEGRIEEMRPKFEISEVGVLIDQNATRDDVWMKLMEVRAIETAVFWSYGDLISYGIHIGWESIYDDVSQYIGKSKSTLQNYVMVSRVFGHSERSEQLGYKHHELLAAVGDKKIRAMLMQKAIADRLTTRQLQALIEHDQLPEPTAAHLKPVHTAFKTYRKRWQKMDAEQRRQAIKQVQAMLNEMEAWGIDDDN